MLGKAVHVGAETFNRSRHLGVARDLRAVGGILAPEAERSCPALRNRDLRHRLFADADAPQDVQRRHAAAVSRKLTLLRAHGLIKKVQGTHRYQLTHQGRITLTALMTARNVGTEALTKLAA